MAMTWLRPLLLFLFLWASTARADPLAGADDPAFRAAFDRVLRADDVGAIDALRDLAARGNTAALVSLPTVQGWFPVADPLAQSRAARQIDGHWITDLGRAAFKPAGLWRDGEISPLMRDQLNRALWLYDMGEDRKGDALLEAWFNHMPEAAPLPDGFVGLAAAPALKAMILLDHLTRGDRKALSVLQYWLDLDLIEGWMVFAELSDHAPVMGGEPIMANLTLGPNVGARLQDGRRAIGLLWHEAPAPPLPPETVAMALHDLMPRPQFGPVVGYCSAACPGTIRACEAAFVTLLGAPYHAVTPATPLSQVMAEPTFFATPRGEQVLLAAAVKHRLGLDRKADVARLVAQSPAFTAAQATNTCFATGVLRALQPFPTSP